MTSNPISVLLAVFLLAAGPVANGKDFAEESVTFSSGGIRLSGTLVIPSKVVAAAVVVHGSGQEPRMTPFAHALAEHGVATLIYDKRGVGKSEGVYVGPEVGTNNIDRQNLDLLAGDASAAVTEMARRLAHHRVPSGLIGFSQAGWIIPLAATRNPEVKFMILWSGPLVTTREQLRFQFLTEGKADFWDSHSAAEVREHVRSGPDRFQFADTDPVDALQRLSIPGLWLFGGRDVSVPVELSIERLRVLAAGGHPFEYRLFPASGHSLGDEAFSASLEWLGTHITGAGR